MPYQTIRDENELPPSPESSTVSMRDFIRLASDPTLMQAGDTGEIFVRRDGKMWKHPAVRVHSPDADRETPQKWEAKPVNTGSNEQFPYTTKQGKVA